MFQIVIYLPLNFFTTFSMSSLSTIHSSVKPHSEHKYLDTSTKVGITEPIEILLPIPTAPV